MTHTVCLCTVVLAIRQYIQHVMAFLQISANFTHSSEDNPMHCGLFSVHGVRRAQNMDNSDNIPATYGLESFLA
jgi:hypothetical protein